MTHEEWSKLVKECKETDSISRRNELRSRAACVAKDLCEVLEKLYNEWGQSFVSDDDYQIGKGGYSLKEFDENESRIVYQDHWSYGGYCDIGITVPMKYLDAHNRDVKSAELREACIKGLLSELKDKHECIETLKRECHDIRTRLSCIERGLLAEVHEGGNDGNK